MTNSSSSDNAGASPNDRLAKIVVEELVSAKLLNKARAIEAVGLLRTGKATASQWRLWAEEMTRVGGRHVKDED